MIFVSLLEFTRAVNCGWKSHANQAKAIGIAGNHVQVVGNTKVGFAKNRRVEVLISSEKFKY
jgi:flagellar motor protein MotB